MPTERRLQKIRDVLSHRQPDLTVVFENIHDPHNVSAILRTCDAVGVLETYLLYTSEPFPRLGKKSSASAKKWVLQKKYSAYDLLFAELREQGYRIFATALRKDAISVYEVDWTQPTAIILGNEHRGVSEEAIRRADAIIFIPQVGMIQSLNVSVAAGVILYEAYRQRFQAGMYSRRRLPEELFARLANQWAGNKEKKSKN